MKSFVARLLAVFTLLASAASAFANEKEQVYLIDLKYHTADGAISPMAIKEMEWPFRLPAPTQEELDEAKNSSEASRQRNGRGLVFVDAVGADGKVHFQTVEPIYIYEVLGDTTEVQDPTFRVRVPVKGTVRVHIRGWRPTTEDTFEIEALLKAYYQPRAAALATAEFTAKPNRINVLVFAEGYVDTPQQKTLFEGDFDTSFKQALMNISPLKYYKGYFNFEAKFFGAPANTWPGILHPSMPCTVPLEYTDHANAQKNGLVPQPYFGTSYCRGTSPTYRRLIPSDVNAVVTKAEELMPGVNLVVLLVNDFTWEGRLAPTNGGTSARREATASPGVVTAVMQRTRPNNAPIGQPATLERFAFGTANVIVHEMSHSMYHLADEYVAGEVEGGTCSDAPTSTSKCEPNVTDVIPAKWGDWDPDNRSTVKCDRNSQTLPFTHAEQCFSKPNFLTTIGLFEGARYKSEGMYRPMYTCKMRAASTDFTGTRFEPTVFCAVCKEAIIRRIYREPAAATATRSAGISLHDEQPNTNHTVPALTPRANPVPIVMAPGETKRFSATPIVPATPAFANHKLGISWFFGGRQLTGTDPFINFTAETSGELEMRITDPTPSEARPYTTNGTPGPLVLTLNRTFGMNDTIRWPIEVRHATETTSGERDVPVQSHVDVLVAKDTDAIGLSYGIVTQEFANRCPGCGDEWRVIVTPLTAGTSAASTNVIFEDGGIAGATAAFTREKTVNVESLTAGGDVTLRLTVIAKSLGDNLAPTTVSASMGGVPGAGCVRCEICNQVPAPPECGLTLGIESATFEPMAANSTQGDHSYVSFEGSSGTNTYKRWIKLKTTPIPRDAKLKTTVYIVNDAGEEVATAVEGTFPTESWPLDQPNPNNFTDWFIRVTAHDSKPIRYASGTGGISHEFRYKVVLTLTRGDRSLTASALVGAVLAPPAPQMPAVATPLHSLRRAFFPDRYAPPREDGRESGGDNWASKAAAAWLSEVRTHDTPKPESQRIFPRMDDISLEHAVNNGQPGRHQYGTDFTIYSWYSVPGRGVDPGRQYRGLREHAQMARRIDRPADSRAAMEILKAWTMTTRAGLDRLVGQRDLKLVRFATGGICPGNTDPEYRYTDGLPDNWMQQMLWYGRIMDAAGNLLIDLEVSPKTWGTGFYIEYTCDANFETTVMLDRCKLGETPPPCGQGRRRAVGKPSCETCLRTTTIAELGQEVTLSVSVKPDPDEIPAFRWYKGAVNDFSQPIENATGSSYKFTATGPEKYWVYIYNSAGFIGSGTNVVICTPPKIMGQTLTAYITTGQSTFLDVETIGSEPKTYEWYTGVSEPTTKLPDSTPTRITVDPKVDTRYWARITNECGTVLSQPILVSVCDPVKIKTQPQSTTIIEDNLGSMSILTTGTEPVTYEWFEGEVDGGGPQVPNCASMTCSVTPKVTTKYWVKVSNRCGVDKSVAVTITVIPKCTAPALAIHPQPQTIDKGEEVTLSVSATGTSPTYQWYFGGKGNTNVEVPGGTTHEIKVKPDTTTSYWVRVRNSCGQADSNAAEVTVIACDPAKVDVQPAGATIEPGETAKLTVTASGTAPLTYQWYQRQLLSGEEIEVDGADGPTLEVTPSRTTWYFVEIDNHCGPPARSNLVAVLVSESCRVPNITTQPVSTSVNQAGDEARLEVRAGGSQPFTYEWFIGTSPESGTLIPNETDAVLVVHPLQTTTYVVRISNDCGQATSVAVTVTVPVPCDLRIVFQPSSTTLLQGQTVSLLGRGEGSGTVTHQWYASPPGGQWQEITGATGTKYDATPNDTTYYFLRATNQCAYVDSEIAVVTVITGCVRPELITQPESITASTATPVQLVSNATGTAPLQYQWYEYINGWPTMISGQTGKTLTVTPTLTLRTFHVRVTNSCFSTVSVNATVQLVPACEPPDITDDPQSKTITRGQSVTLTTAASGTFPSFQWYRGDGSGNWTLISGQTAESLTESPQITTYYYVTAKNACGEDSSNYAIVTVNETGGGGPCTAPPTINKHIESMTVSSGAPATMTILAQNVGHYEWYRSTNLSGGSWQKVEGATTYFLTVHPTETTYYFVRVINDCGHRDSMVATISVASECVEPQVIWISDIIKFYPGDQIAVDIQASGTNLKYTWYKSDPAGSGQQRLSGTGPTITDYPQSDEVMYWAYVSNECGNRFSGYAWARSLTMCTIPRITRQPQDQTISVGESATLSVTVEAQTEISYQWYASQLNFFAWYPLDGETSRTLTVSPNTSTAYYCEITVECATIKSSGAAVYVQP